MQGKWKISQNRSRDDRTGVVAGLRKSGRAEDVALADMIAKTLDN